MHIVISPKENGIKGVVVWCNLNTIVKFNALPCCPTTLCCTRDCESENTTASSAPSINAPVRINIRGKIAIYIKFYAKRKKGA